MIGEAHGAASVDGDAARRAYTLRGGSARLTCALNGGLFLWKRLAGDLTIAADVIPPPVGQICLMVRQSLDPEAVAAAVVVRATGAVALETREAPGGPVRELQARVMAPTRLRLERRGHYLSFSVAGPAETWIPASGSVWVPLAGECLVGLGLMGPEAETTFGAVDVAPGEAAPTARLVSTLEIMTVATRRRRVVHCAVGHFEAPNWARDGATLFFNRQGRIYRMPVTGVAPGVPVDTGFAIRCNNDHGLSPDGKTLVVSDHSEAGHSLIYTLPSAGGVPRRLTARGPSYWHGWSPDGQTLVYCAERDGRFGLFTIPATGGEERRLTLAAPGGLDDGPDYSPDGRWIYFNSDRTGRMQIWRVHPEGTGLEQVTDDGYNNWFAHPSPDGQWLVLLSYGGDVVGHPANQDVQLRLMPAAGGELTVLARCFGGQGTINVPSWSPDSREFAFVTYQLVP